VPLGTKETKASSDADVPAIFKVFTNGDKTNRDAWAFNFSGDALASNIRRTISFYNDHVDRFRRVARQRPDIDNFVEYDDRSISWSGDLKQSVARLAHAEFSPEKIRRAQYRPFTVCRLFFDRIFNNRVYLLPSVFPNPDSERENRAIGVTGHLQIPFSSLVVDNLPCLDFGGRPTQFFPFYTYDEDGTNRRENITDWALTEFRKHYGDKKISKWDIFHYTYGLLHHPEYRTRYAANLKRELPRIPMAPEFRRVAEIGATLMKLHIEYEKQAEYPLERREAGKLNWRVEKMTLSKDKSLLRYNEFLTLSGIPPEVQEYKLGNRSALEWVVDQYRVSTDARSGIVNDPNRPDDPEYIVRLLGQVVAVSVETVRLVRELAGLSIDQA